MQGCYYQRCPPLSDRRRPRPTEHAQGGAATDLVPHRALVQDAVQVGRGVNAGAVDGQDDVAQHQAAVLVPSGTLDAGLGGGTAVAGVEHQHAVDAELLYCGSVVWENGAGVGEGWRGEEGVRQRVWTARRNSSAATLVLLLLPWPPPSLLPPRPLLLLLPLPPAPMLLLLVLLPPSPELDRVNSLDWSGAKLMPIIGRTTLPNVMICCGRARSEEQGR